MGILLFPTVDLVVYEWIPLFRIPWRGMIWYDLGHKMQHNKKRQGFVQIRDETKQIIDHDVVSSSRRYKSQNNKILIKAK